MLLLPASHAVYNTPPALANNSPPQDAVRGEFREVAKLLSDNGGRVYEDGALVPLKDSKLAGVFGYVPQQMFDFDPEWCAAGGGGGAPCAATSVCFCQPPMWRA